ncbi:hypothetical protein IN817_23035 (plasmid) [Salmonella enterica subsp. enterica serovar Enteritidis]|uniref:hypothetical protein n=1 Tax=Salmonella enterica TaxID=28901 RepID=UPI00187913A0|nr:hypothetical protein [Salmonella enterica]QOT86943.1 hypothetical protein IN817_23035 [Salmonella enterica subsp. enterica serovar Enteritidis]
MPNHDRFECQTAIDSDAILQLTERDARIYSQYLQTEHKGFVKLAEELAADR